MVSSDDAKPLESAAGLIAELTMELVVELADEQATVEFGQHLGKCLQGGEVVTLDGPLGAGKTTLCRGVLLAWGHQGAVKSPTYTLVEPYVFAECTVYHFDLYRLGHPEELEFMGIRDYFDNHSVALIEWPERGEGWLPSADLSVEILLKDCGRRLRVRAETARGRQVLERVGLQRESE